MEDIKINATQAMEQAGMTAEDYLRKAYKILDDEYEEWSVKDAIELAKVIAQDFHTMMMCSQLQEIRKAIEQREFFNERMD